MTQQAPVKPLFTTMSQINGMGHVTIAFAVDDYNKKSGAALIDAKNDAEAIAAFLNEYKDSPATIRSYAKEIERLILWCIHVGQITVSSLKRDHILAYQEFLKSPSPQKYWCGPCVPRLTRNSTLNPHWRPFVKGLSGSSINKAIKILDSFFNYFASSRRTPVFVG